MDRKTQPVDRAMVRNAADPKQVKNADRVERDRADGAVDDLIAVMSTSQGRRDRWRLLTRCGVYKSIFVTSSEIYYRAGWQDVGHFLVAELIETCPALYRKMQMENDGAGDIDLAIAETSTQKVAE